MMEASIVARLRVLGASYEFPIELSATGSCISLPCKTFSFGIVSLLSGQNQIFEKHQWHVHEEKPFYSDPRRALLVKGESCFSKTLMATFSTGCPRKKYTSLKSYIFFLRTDNSLNFVSFVRQDLNLNFET